MKSFLRFLIFSILLFSSQIFPQNDWLYTQQIYFPQADSNIVRPYLSTLATDGTLWLISSRILDVSAHNAIYFLSPGDTVFQKFIDFDNNGDSDSLVGNIGSLRGITTLGNTLYVTATQPYPKTAPNTVSVTYLYPNFDTLLVEKYGFGLPSGGGYGSFNHGCDISKDSVLFAGISFNGPTFRCYNFSHTFTVSGYASYIPPPTYYLEPGGPQLGGIDLIRDVALIPNADYNLTTTKFYTSRNSYSGTQLTGGIAVWDGGTQTNPYQAPDVNVFYTGNRVTDFDGFLSFIELYPCGITVDKDGYLWVAGVDSTRRWVKAFMVDGINAIQMFDLPSQFSEDLPDPDGAPMTSPADVVLNSTADVAYVIDLWSRAAFKFVKGPVKVEEESLSIFDFMLDQNYPNPFNPSTVIRFSLSEASAIKLIITDMLGIEVETLMDEFVQAGNYTKFFNAENLSSGIYFYSLITPNQKISKKMILVK